jgi:hypothetical protein
MLWLYFDESGEFLPDGTLRRLTLGGCAATVESWGAFNQKWKAAMDAAVATLPDPISSAHVKAIAETILRTAKDGERDPATLQRMALLELQITPRD